MKKIFILYLLTDEGQTLMIDPELQNIIKRVKKGLADYEKYANEDVMPIDAINPNLLHLYWVNQYEVDQPSLSNAFNEVLDANEKEPIEDLDDLNHI